MSIGDKAKHAVDQATGKTKEAVGHAVGNERLEAEGRAQKDEARAAHKIDQAKDSAKNLGQEAKGKIKEVAGAVGDDEGLEVEGKADQYVARSKEHLNK